MDDAIVYVGWALLMLVLWVLASIGLGYVWHKHHERARKLFRRRQVRREITDAEVMKEPKL